MSKASYFRDPGRFSMVFCCSFSGFRKKAHGKNFGTRKFDAKHSTNDKNCCFECVTIYAKPQQTFYNTYNLTLHDRNTTREKQGGSKIRDSAQKSHICCGVSSLLVKNWVNFMSSQEIGVFHE